MENLELRNETPIRTGEPRKTETGAQRDNAKGKGRCDLLPLNEVAEVMEDKVIKEIGLFMKTKDKQHIINAIKESKHTIPGFDKGFAHMMLEVSILYEMGAELYGENNWKRGMPLKWYINSGTRHYLKALRGDNDERHDRAFVWNMLGALWTINNIEGALDNLITIQ